MIRWNNHVVLFVAGLENVKILNIIYFRKNISLVFSIICSKCKNEDKIIFKEEESIEVFNTPGSFKNV